MMFTQTLRRLTLLNSIVFLLIFVVFGAIIYGYVARQLFDDVDDEMLRKAQAIRITNGHPGFAVGPGAFFDPRIFIFFRDEEGQIITLYPFPVEEITRAQPHLPQIASGALLNQRIEDHLYRIRSIPYTYDENILLRNDIKPSKIVEVLAVTVVDSELATLRELAIIIVAGLIIGMIVIILAGYYLAKRALIPVRGAWDKQQRFVADASHELRTPLSVVKVNAELLLRHPERTIEQESLRIMNVLRETSRMSRLVATLLTLARADANEVELNLAPLVFTDMIKAVAEQFQTLATLRDIEFILELEERIILNADKERLHQLLVILLDNAMKYTSQSGKIIVSCRQQTPMVVLAVQDTGCGIPPEELPCVFDRFFRGDKARSREAGGVGLGLSIAKWIVEKHGGKIHVESTIGVGTKFSVYLPYQD